MPGPQNILLIEGSFRELIEELADYIDNVQKTQSGEESSSVRKEIGPLLEAYIKAEESQDAEEIESARDEVIEPVVDASPALANAPEKEFIAAYNLLIHLINQSPNITDYLQRMCRNLTSSAAEPPTPAALNRQALALSVLTTIFNILPPGESVRYPVFSAILDVVSRSSSGYDILRPQLADLGTWLENWKTQPALQRRLYGRIATLARESGETEEDYAYLVRALRTIPTSEASSEEAQKLSIQALRQALSSPHHFDFEDLTAIDAVQGLRQSEPVWFQMLEVFSADGLEEYEEFKSEHAGFVDSPANNLDDAALTRKIRLLTLASLAAGAGQSRSLPYSAISDALKVPSEDVEVWVIDVIRAGLVEGKLSQQNQTFLIHRSTYRVFGLNQWREVNTRLDMWRESLTGVLEVIRQEKEAVIAQKEAELRALESKTNGMERGGERRGYARAMQREPVDVGMD